jgi:CubicO group peptidase (beta-lactamase class C family)
MLRHRNLTGLVAIALLGAALAVVPARARAEGFVWPQAAAAEERIDPALPEALRRELAALPRIYSFGMVRHGKLVFEYYREGTTAATPVNVASVTKSVLGLLVAVALDKGIFRSVDQPIADFFPELQGANVDPRARTLTLRHLLTMTAGWELLDLDTPPFHATEALARPLTYAPGERFQYDSATSQLIAVALQRAAGMPLDRFAEEHLFGPLDIRDPVWGRGEQGIVLGWHMLRINLRDMLKIGQLVLNKGSWHGRQLIPAAAIAELVVPRHSGPPPGQFSYGYHWYVVRTPDGKHDVFAAFGYGGQLIYVVPALDLVIAKTQTREQLRGDSNFMNEIVMPAIRP